MTLFNIKEKVASSYKEFGIGAVSDLLVNKNLMGTTQRGNSRVKLN